MIIACDNLSESGKYYDSMKNRSILFDELDQNRMKNILEGYQNLSVKNKNELQSIKNPFLLEITVNCFLKNSLIGKNNLAPFKKFQGFFFENRKTK